LRSVSAALPGSAALIGGRPPHSLPPSNGHQEHCARVKDICLSSNEGSFCDKDYIPKTASSSDGSSADEDCPPDSESNNDWDHLIATIRDSKPPHESEQSETSMSQDRVIMSTVSDAAVVSGRVPKQSRTGPGQWASRKLSLALG
ncbi:hypothetical protein KUCAC02_022541, partial [Chaenocephalus aceratus]